MSSTSTSAMALLAANRYDSNSLTVKKLPKLPNPKTTYDDNFNFSFSFYQPMIEYLDKKLSGLQMKKEDLPHLPFMNERGLERNRASFREHAAAEKTRGRREPLRVRSYTEKDFKDLMGRSEVLRNLRQQPAEYEHPSRSLVPLSMSTSASSIGSGQSIKTGAASSSGYSSASSVSGVSVRRSFRRTVVTGSSDGGTSTKVTSGGGLEDRHVSFATPGTIKRSKSFGAFTEKAARDVEADMHADILRNIAGKFRTVVKATGTVKRNLPPISPSSSRRHPVGDSASEIIITRRKSVQFDNDDDDTLSMVSSIKSPSVISKPSIPSDPNTNNVEFWKDLW